MSGVAALSRVAPFGARLRDGVTGRPVAEGLRLRAWPGGDLRRPATVARVNSGAVWHLQDLPGLREAEFGEGDDDYWATVQRRPFLLRVDDPQGRYLPFSLTVELPVRGLFGFDEGASPPTAELPLFSAPTRPLPEACVVLRAELREAASGRPAAWALVTARIGGRLAGRGLADAAGRLLLAFPFPEPVRPPLTSPPPAVAEPAWQVDLQAFYRPADPVPEFPDLAAALAQVDHPCRLLETLSPPSELPAQAVAYHRETVVRSLGANGGPAPHLFIEAA